MLGEDLSQNIISTTHFILENIIHTPPPMHTKIYSSIFVGNCASMYFSFDTNFFQWHARALIFLFAFSVKALSPQRYTGSHLTCDWLPVYNCNMCARVIVPEKCSLINITIPSHWLSQVRIIFSLIKIKINACVTRSSSRSRHVKSLMCNQVKFKEQASYKCDV